MTALAADRNTVRAGRQFPDSPVPLGVKASTKIYGGSLCVIDAGVAAPGRTATGLVPLGISRKTYDNTAGAASAIVGEFDQADGWFVNSGGDLVVAADIGADCYITDDQTVCHTATGKSRAGKVIALDATLGVLVRVVAGL